MNVVASCVVARSKEVTCLSPLPSLARIYLPLDKQSEEGGYVHMMSAWGGRGGTPTQKQTTVLISFLTLTVTKGGRGPKSENFADVICSGLQGGKENEHGERGSAILLRHCSHRSENRKE